MELLSTGRIGRLIYNSRYGPVALPSEYKIHEGSIVFRTYRVTFTEEDLRTGIAHAEYQVVVEVDQTDPEAREGWVVLVRGGPRSRADFTAASQRVEGVIQLRVFCLTVITSAPGALSRSAGRARGRCARRRS